MFLRNIDMWRLEYQMILMEWNCETIRTEATPTVTLIRRRAVYFSRTTNEQFAINTTVVLVRFSLHGFAIRCTNSEKFYKM
jgi:hypothetical protein